jgi:hypothetical protein
MVSGVGSGRDLKDFSQQVDTAARSSFAAGTPDSRPHSRYRHHAMDIF